MNEVFKSEKKEYFVTLDGKPLCAPFNDEPGVFDKCVFPIYDSFVSAFGSERVRIVCVSYLVHFNKNEHEESE